MAAAAFVKLLPPNVSVHLVESEAIGIVGVGEATLPHIRAFNERIGINEADFMRWTRATFKLGIEFIDWGAIGDNYIHPFGTFGHGGGDVDFHQFWLRLKQEGYDVPDLQQLSMGVHVARQNRFQLPDRDPRSIASTFGYAYQFDATLFAPYLRHLAEAQGAKRHRGQGWCGANRDGESGDIASV
jgi:tryptophan halogenase